MQELVLMQMVTQKIANELVDNIRFIEGSVRCKMNSFLIQKETIIRPQMLDRIDIHLMPHPC